METIFPFICCGSVDDGKSTLIGKILLEAGCIKKDQLEDAKRVSLKNGSNTIELALLLDGLISEREQQITIDIAHRYFDYQNIRFHILDCPGHEQYTKNMATAAAITDTALVVIDCKKGIQPQTIRHIEICNLFNVKNLCICITKCDLIITKKGLPDRRCINKLTNQINALMKAYNFNYNVIPVSALNGFQIDKLLNQIVSYAKHKTRQQKKVIFHIQTARYYKKSRYYIGHSIFNNELQVGSKYTIYPQNKTVTIKNKPAIDVIQIEENMDIADGDCITNTKVVISDKINHNAIWFDKPAKSMLLRHGKKCTKIISYSDSEIQLETPIIFNDITDIKENGFGIIINSDNKKTIGCCIFKNNNNKNDKKTFFDFRTLSKNEQEKKIYYLKNKYPHMLLVIDSKYIDKFYTSKYSNSLQKLSSFFKEQGKIVVLI